MTKADEVDAGPAVEHFGGLDIMVNNAGITRDATMRKMTEEQFDEVIAVHLKGTWNGTKAAAAIMRENSAARSNMSSISGKVGLVGQTNYSAAKAGIVGMTKAAARNCPPRGAGQRDPAGPDQICDDRGHAPTHLGPEAGRGADGRPASPPRWPRSRCSWPAICRRT